MISPLNPVTCHWLFRTLPSIDGARHRHFTTLSCRAWLFQLVFIFVISFTELLGFVTMTIFPDFLNKKLDAM